MKVTNYSDVVTNVADYMKVRRAFEETWTEEELVDHFFSSVNFFPGHYSINLFQAIMRKVNNPFYKYLFRIDASLNCEGDPVEIFFYIDEYSIIHLKG